MVLCDSTIVEDVSKLINGSPIQCSISSTGELLLNRSSGTPLKGFATIILGMVKDCVSSTYCPHTVEEKALLHQWLEYCVTVVNYCDTQPAALTELNNILSERSFLIGSRVTVADIVWCLTLHPVMELLSMQDKERYSHLCRWYSTIQSCSGLRAVTKKKQIIFSKNPLY